MFHWGVKLCRPAYLSIFKSYNYRKKTHIYIIFGSRLDLLANMCGQQNQIIDLIVGTEHNDSDQ